MGRVEKGLILYLQSYFSLKLLFATINTIYAGELAQVSQRGMQFESFHSLLTARKQLN